MDSTVPSRKRLGLAEIKLRIAEFKDSGLSKAKFAARLGVHPLSMDRWLRITHPTQSPQSTHSSASQNSPAFVPLLCTPSASASSADWPEIVAPSGWAFDCPQVWIPQHCGPFLIFVPNAELSLQHSGLSRGRSDRSSQALRYAGRGGSQFAAIGSSFGSPFCLQQSAS